MIEIWKDIEGYDGLYQVSNFGRVKSFWHKTPQIMTPSPNKNGRPHVTLSHDGKQKSCDIHRLVAQAFVPNPESKPEVNHIDGNPRNNHVDNLEWCTRSENILHAFRTGLKSTPQGEGHPHAKLTNEQAKYIRENPDGLTGRELARMFGVVPATISGIQQGKKYRNADGAIRTTRLPDPHRVPDEAREEIRREYKPNVRGYDCRALARKYGVGQKTILRIVNEK